MTDKRRSKRLPIDLSLNISDLFKQDKLVIPNIDSPIEVVDISKHGIGFVSECVLPDGYYFNAKIDLGSADSSIFTVVKIVRSDALSKDKYMYGANFEGISDTISDLIDEYAKKIKN